MKSKVELACELPKVDLAERINNTVNALIKNAKLITEEVDGYTLFFPADEAAITQIHDFIIQERSCCSFLELKLIIPPNFQDVSLAILGSPVVKSFIHQLLPDEMKMQKSAKEEVTLG